MHIPDGFLTTPIMALTWIITLVVIAYAIKQTKNKLTDAHIPLMGILAAFVFAAQMLNIPVAAGTSGHFLGGVLVAIFVGPWAGTVIMACVFIVQALIFQDGGILAMGANIFNMGIIGTLCGYYIYTALKKMAHNKILAAGVTSWLTVVLASAFCSLELAASGTSPLHMVLPAMVGVHTLIGIIEAAITIVVISTVLKSRPDLLSLEVTS